MHIATVVDSVVIRSPPGTTREWAECITYPPGCISRCDALDLAVTQVGMPMTPLAKLVRYQLDVEAPVAQHGQGEIWKATDLLFDEIVALKQIRADLQDDPSALESFRKEAAAGARLGRLSANIVPVRDYGR